MDEGVAGLSFAVTNDARAFHEAILKVGASLSQRNAKPAPAVNITKSTPVAPITPPVHAATSAPTSVSPRNVAAPAPAAKPAPVLFLLYILILS